MLLKRVTLAAVLGLAAIGATVHAFSAAPRSSSTETVAGAAGARGGPGRQAARPGGQGPALPLAGVVLDGAGRPVADAVIYLRESRPARPDEYGTLVRRVATAGKDGRFRLEIDPGRHTFAPPRDRDGAPWQSALIAAAAPGHGPAWVEAVRAAGAGAELRLVAEGPAVRGRLLGSQGRPVAGAAIRVEQIAAVRGVDLDSLLATGSVDWDRLLVAGNFEGTPFRDPAWIGRDGTVTTDARGRFEIRGLGRDRVAILAVEGKGLERARVLVVDRPAQPRAGGTPRPGQPGGVDPQELPVHGATFDLVVGPAKPLTGLVRTKEGGRPAPGVTVAGQAPGRPWSAVMTVSDERGRYRLDGLPKSESYSIDARPAPGSPYLAARATVADTAGLEPIDAPLDLPRGVPIEGRVVDRESGRAVRCEQVHYFPLPPDPAHAPIFAFLPGPDDTFRLTAPAGPGLLVAKVVGPGNPYPQAHFTEDDKKRGLKERDGQGAGFPLQFYNAYRFVEVPEGGSRACAPGS